MKLSKIILEVKKITDPKKIKFLSFSIGDKVKFLQHDANGDRWVKGVITNIKLEAFEPRNLPFHTDNIDEAHIGYMKIEGYHICNQDDYVHLHVYFDYNIVGNMDFKKYDDQRFYTLEKIDTTNEVKKVFQIKLEDDRETGNYLFRFDDDTIIQDISYTYWDKLYRFRFETYSSDEYRKFRKFEKFLKEHRIEYTEITVNHGSTTIVEIPEIYIK